MDYEKAYKEALERARKLYNDAKVLEYTQDMEDYETIFPELKESEDERIRKALVRFHKSTIDVDGIKGEEIVAWLEKQGKSTTIDIDKMVLKYSQTREPCTNGLPVNCQIRAYRQGVNDTLRLSLNLEKQDEQKNKINSYKITFEDVLVLECAMKTIKITEGGNELYEKLAPLYNKIHNVYLLEKQGEQKVPINDFKAKNWYVSEVDSKIHDMTYNPANKVEPKFKVDDWIANDYCTGKVIALTDDAYLLDSGQGIPFSCEHNAHLWTIRDAKDGDVLACGDKVTDCPFIFHNLTEEQNPRSYCGVNTSGDFQYNDENGGFWCKSDEVRPATKEQRELLFQKMKEAGYQWNPEKKELKKIEQKPVNDTVETIVEAVSNTSILDMIEDKDAFTNPSAFENSLGRLLKLFEKLPKQDLLDGLKFYANVVEHDGEYVKPAWSKEDDAYKLYAISAVEGYYDEKNPLQKDLIEWLKSLKERLS